MKLSFSSQISYQLLVCLTQKSGTILYVIRYFLRGRCLDASEPQNYSHLTVLYTSNKNTVIRLAEKQFG